MNKIIIFGIGQIAEIVHYYLTNESEHEVVAFVVDKAFIKEDSFHDLPVVPFEEVEHIYCPQDYKMIVPISYKKMNRIREEKYLQAKEKGYEFISYISPKANCHAQTVGENCFIFENNVIQPFVNIGNNVIIWSGNHIGHHSNIADHCFIASHAVISGAVNIGKNSFIGVNATIRDNVNIGAENLIGAGALILSDTSDKAVLAEKHTELAKITSNKIRNI